MQPVLMSANGTSTQWPTSCVLGTLTYHVMCSWYSHRSSHDSVCLEGPSKATSSDLWHMAWQLNSSRVVMLSNLIEDGRVSNTHTYEGRSKSSRPELVLFTIKL